MSRRRHKHLSPSKRLDYRCEELKECLEAIRAMVDMVGVTKDNPPALFNQYTGEYLSDDEDAESVFLSNLYIENPDTIIVDLARMYYRV